MGTINKKEKGNSSRIVQLGRQNKSIGKQIWIKEKEEELILRRGDLKTRFGTWEKKTKIKAVGNQKIR